MSGLRRQPKIIGFYDLSGDASGESWVYHSFEKPKYTVRREMKRMIFRDAHNDENAVHKLPSISNLPVDGIFANCQTHFFPLYLDASYDSIG